MVQEMRKKKKSKQYMNKNKKLKAYIEKTAV